jgi:hypothetical protein
MTDGEFDNLTVNNILTIGADTNLYRSAANVLKTDDSLEIAGQLYLNSYNGIKFWAGEQLKLLWEYGWGSRFIQSDGQLGFFVPSTSSVRFYSGTDDPDTATLTALLTYQGQLQLPRTSSSGGIVIGEDTNLYRGASNHLQTDSSLTICGNLYTLEEVKLSARAPLLSNEQMVKEVYFFEGGCFSPVVPDSGTSFPGSPDDGDLFNRTDQGFFYQYKSSLSDWFSLGSNDGNIPVGVGHLRFYDTGTGSYLNLFLTTSKDNYNAPLLTTDQGLLVKKDIAAGGYLSSNQGALFLGSGLTSQVDPPKIVLMNADVSRLDGGGLLDIPVVPSYASHPGSPVAGQTYKIPPTIMSTSILEVVGRIWVQLQTLLVTLIRFI